MNSASATRGERQLVVVHRLLGAVESTLAFIAGATIFGLMLLAIAQIVGRTIFNAPIFGYIDFIEITMILFTVGAISYTQRLGGHVRMEIVLGRLKGRTLWISETAATIGAIVVVVPLIYFSWSYAMLAYVNGDSTIDAELPTWPAKMVVPVALSVLLLRLILQLVEFVWLVRRPDREPKTVPTLMDAAAHAREEIEDALGPDGSRRDD